MQIRVSSGATVKSVTLITDCGAISSQHAPHTLHSMTKEGERMQHGDGGQGSGLALGRAGAMLKEIALKESVSARPPVDVCCREPRVHETWHRSSRGIFNTCPMCDCVVERPFSHY
jgi:hypothetical protein